MSIDTSAIVFGAPGAEEIAAAIRTAFNVEVHVETDGDEFFRIRFSEPGGGQPGQPSSRNMHVFPNMHTKTRDHKDIYTGEYTYCSLGCWGQSVEIMEAIASRFGGYVLDNDMHENWRKVEANPETAPELSDEDVLRIELADIAGPKFGTALAALVDEPEKLEKIMEAYSRYKERKGDLAPAL